MQKRLSVSVSIETHKALKVLAAQNEETINGLVVAAINVYLQRQRKGGYESDT
jgi:predicted HicB family RNase H-like nuclease